MDFSWFLTIPGMLITGGVLLLIIALIIFITTSGKKEKSKKQENSQVNNQMGTPTPVNDMGPTPNSQPTVAGNNELVTPDMNAISASPSNIDINEPNISVVNQNTSLDAIAPIANNAQEETPMVSSFVEPQPSVSDASVMNTQNTSINSAVTPVENELPIDSNMTASTQEVTQVMDTPSVQTPEIVPIDSASPVEPQEVIANVENPTIQPQEVTPVVEQPVVATQDVVPVMDIPVAQNIEASTTFDQNVAVAKVQEVTPIYGGADPTASVAVDQNNHHQIYGGADPLENTQVIPVQQQTAPQENVAPVQEVVTPAVEPVVSTNPAVVGVDVIPASNSSQ